MPGALTPTARKSLSQQRDIPRSRKLWGVGVSGLPNGPKACEAAAAHHAEQTQRSERPKRAQKTPQHLAADLAVPSKAAELSPGRLRGGPQV